MIKAPGTPHQNHPCRAGPTPGTRLIFSTAAGNYARHSEDRAGRIPRSLYPPHCFSQFLGNRCRSPQDTPCSTCCRGHAGHTNGTHRTCHARTAPGLLPAWRHGQGRLPLHAPVHSRRHALAMEYRCTEDGSTLILVSYSYETRNSWFWSFIRVSYEYDTSLTHEASAFHHAAMHEAAVRINILL